MRVGHGRRGWTLEQGTGSSHRRLASTPLDRLPVDFEEKLLVDAIGLPFAGSGEQLVAQAHEHTQVAGGMLSERRHDLGAHELWAAGLCQGVLEMGKQLLDGSRLGAK